MRNEDCGFFVGLGDEALRRAQDGEMPGVVFWWSIRKRYLVSLIHSREVLLGFLVKGIC